MVMVIERWHHIKDRFESDSALLLGNGASIAVNNTFSYRSLKDYAFRNGLLLPDIQQLFNFFQTDDFELILRMVWHAFNVNKALNIKDYRTSKAYFNVRGALIQTIQAIHPEYQKISNQLPNIYNFLKGFETVVSLNYDLIVYWAMMYGNGLNVGHVLKDGFLYGGFDENWSRLRNSYGAGNQSSTLVFYPHGNLILVRDMVEAESKIAVGSGDLLNSVLNTWLSENYVPLFVSEGTSEQKVKTIRNSNYLSTVYREVLPTLPSKLVIYGWGFGEHDLHILRQIKLANVKTVAISLYMRSSMDVPQDFIINAYKVVREELGPEVEVIFFDSKSPGCWKWEG